jgi:hypothetical protein
MEDASVQHERIVIFDEAQRAWDREAIDRFAKKKNKEPPCMSQSAFLISVPGTGKQSTGSQRRRTRNRPACRNRRF